MWLCCCKETVDCVRCSDSPPKCWEVAFSGVTEGPFCTDCDFYNATFVLIHNLAGCAAGNCCWASAEHLWICDLSQEDTMGGRAVSLTLSESSPNRNWALIVLGRDQASSGKTVAAYSLSEDMEDPDFDETCYREVTLQKFADETNHCTGFPSSVTLTPTTCPT